MHTNVFLDYIAQVEKIIFLWYDTAIKKEMEICAQNKNINS